MKSVLGIRLDAALRDSFEKFRDNRGLTDSQAARLALTMGLANIDKLDVAWAEATFREGNFAGRAAVRQALAEISKK